MQHDVEFEDPDAPIRLHRDARTWCGAALLAVMAGSAVVTGFAMFSAWRLIDLALIR